MRFSLALDLGSTSIGFAMYQLDQAGERTKLLRVGVRIFPNGRENDGTSLAVHRRLKRQARRMRDRKIRRGKAILRTLIEWGMMPKEKEAQRFLLQDLDAAGQGNDTRPPSDPYNLRARALTEKLPLAHLGRALYHLHQHRGFKSNRKTDKAAKDTGVVLKGVEALQKQLADTGSPTLGAYLAQRKNDNQHVRLRSGMADEAVRLYPARAMLESEFWAIWNAQAKYHPDVLNDERGQHLFRVIFFQRPLRKPEVGFCVYNSSERRIAKSDPLFQRFRMLKELNELLVTDATGRKRSLTMEERNKLLHEMMNSRAVSFTKMRKLLGLPTTSLFNKESERREHILGDETAALIAAKKAAGAQWRTLALPVQRELVLAIIDEDDLGVLQDKLKQHLTLPEDQLLACCQITLPVGYCSIGESAALTLCDEMARSVISETQAAAAGKLTSAVCSGYFDTLPPYQEVLPTSLSGGTGNPADPYDARMGRITNPTVHIGLNQLRKMVNRIIKQYGKPAEITVEVARDLGMSPDKLKTYNNELGKKTVLRDKIRKRVTDAGYQPTRDTVNLVRLWQEMPKVDGYDPETARLCVYTGAAITFDMLMNGDADTDHILPASITLDDSANNKIVCLRSANRQKGNRAPADVPEWADNYGAILSRADKLSTSRKRRFQKGALDDFLDENKFLARHLVDTQYLSRISRIYLSCLFEGESDDAANGHPLSKVKAVPGRLTSILRAIWGYNSVLDENQEKKDRTDHRHHAIDAAVIGLITPSLVQKFSRLARSLSAEDMNRLVANTYRRAAPNEALRDQLVELLQTMIVSHKADKGSFDPARGLTSGQLHKDTSYGVVGNPNDRGNAVSRALLTALTPSDISGVRGDHLRQELELIANEAGIYDQHEPEMSAKERAGVEKTRLTNFQSRLLDLQRNHPVYGGTRRVRLIENLTTIKVNDDQGKAFKSYKGDSNDYADVWRLPDGSLKVEITSTFNAHRGSQTGNESEVKRKYPTASKLARLRKNDMVAYERDGRTICGRVAKFSKGNVAISEHFRSGTDGYDTMSAKKMLESDFRMVKVDEIGNVFDPKKKRNTAR